MINKWIEENYYKLKKYLSFIDIEDFDDIYHEVLLQFMVNKKSKKLIRDGDAFKYILKMFKLNCFSETAPYKANHKYIKRKIDDENSDDICIIDVNQYLHKLEIEFYYKYIYIYYINEKVKKPSYSKKQLSKESEVPLSTINDKFSLIKKYIIKCYEENRNN